MCIILHTRHCASFVQKRDVGIYFYSPCLRPGEALLRRRMRDAPVLM